MNIEMVLDSIFGQGLQGVNMVVYYLFVVGVQELQLVVFGVFGVQVYLLGLVMVVVQYQVGVFMGDQCVVVVVVVVYYDDLVVFIQMFMKYFQKGFQIFCFIEYWNYYIQCYFKVFLQLLLVFVVYLK